MKTNPRSERALRELKDMTAMLKTLVDEVRVQVHLGTMELKDDAGPYLSEVSSASRSAAREFVKRGKQLRESFKKIRVAHRAR